MTSIGLAGLSIVILSAIVLTLFALLNHRSPLSFRSIRAFIRIQRAARLVVEDGTRLHFSLGSGNLLSQAGASALSGLALLRRLGEFSSLSDRPSFATSGTGLLNLLTQDTLRAAHAAVAVDQNFDMSNARMTGITPFSYVAGVMPMIRDENISSNIIIGNFGSEVGLLIDAAERQNATVIAASESLTAQAVLFASSPETLIGEELFAAGAYLNADSLHSASLLLQDIMRWLIIFALLVGAGLKLVGMA